MLKTLQKRDLMMRILLGVVMSMIGLAMLITLVPGPVGSTGDVRQAIADVGGDIITRTDVQRVLTRISGRQVIPRYLEPFYARQATDQLIFDRLLKIEAGRLGISVSDAELAERIKRLLPSAFAGDARQADDCAGAFRFEVRRRGRRPRHRAQQVDLDLPAVAHGVVLALFGHEDVARGVDRKSVV